MQNGKTAPNHLPPSVCTTIFSNKTPKPKTQNSLWNNSPLISAYALLPFPPNTQPMARRSGRPNEVCWLFVVSKFGKKFVPI
jgi:hypothetical protein